MFFRASSRVLGRGLVGCSAAAVYPFLSTTRFVAPPRAEETGASWSPSWDWKVAVGRPGLSGPRQPGPALRPDEPLFTRAEVALRDGSRRDGAVWMTYRDGVYDVTEYLQEHPGGSFLLQGAGGPVEGFWARWAQHHLSWKVEEALERLRIGRLSDYQQEQDEAQRGGGVWEDEQMDECREENRRKAGRYCEMPYVSETKRRELDKTYLTPAEALYVRNHAPVPNVPPADAHEHMISVCHGESEVANMSLADLHSRFPVVSAVAILQCSGNRAADNIAANGVKSSGFLRGPYEHIGLGLVGNVCWHGILLADVLREVLPRSVLRGDNLDGLHATFEGMDGYSTSTPLRYIMDPGHRCMLATQMNGSPLSPDHGFPVRALLPGITGARQVKWVSKITVGAECSSPWNATYYKDGAGGKPLQRLPMNSLILSPAAGSQISAEATSVEVSGVAYSGGIGSCISSVEVSTDRGKTWQPAVCHFDEASRHDPCMLHSWVKFRATAQLLPAVGAYMAAVNSGPLQEIWCRASTATGETQLEVGAAHGGYFYNGYHKVSLVRVPSGGDAE